MTEKFITVRDVQAGGQGTAREARRQQVQTPVVWSEGELYIQIEMFKIGELHLSFWPRPDNQRRLWGTPGTLVQSFHFTGEEANSEGLNDLAKVTLLMSGGSGIRAQGS